MPPAHSALRVHEHAQWRDIHFANDPVDCTRYEIVPRQGTAVDQLADVGGALRAVLSDALATRTPLRVGGGRWSLSSIGRPTGALLDLANYERLGVVPPSWLSPAYLAATQNASRTPVLLAAGMTIRAVHRELARKNLALQTSGASDGQTFAGAISTGTHGADLRVGALHDTVTALHIVVADTRSFLIQRSDGGLTARAAETLANWFGIPCELVSNDQLFRAAQVHLGSLGVVLNVFSEAVPLYYMLRQRSPHRDGDPRWRDVVRDRRPNEADPSHPADPDYLQLIVNPYLPEPGTDPRSWVISMQKIAFHNQAGVITTSTDMSLKSDIADVLPGLVHVYEDDIELPANPLLRAVTSSQLRSLYGTAVTSASALPSVMFGPPDFLGIDFDPVRGASAEYVFDAVQARTGVDVILGTLTSQATAHNQYLGGIGVRFVRGSDAWLAPNARAMNCYVELQSVQTNELSAIHKAIGAALSHAGVAYGGHWGQWEMNTPEVTRRWWGQPAIDAWKGARAEILGTAAGAEVFASPILAAAGLA